MNILDFSIIDEGIRSGATGNSGAARTATDARFSSLLAKQIGQSDACGKGPEAVEGSKDESSGDGPGRNEDARAERVPQESTRGERQEVRAESGTSSAGAESMESGLDTGPRLGGLEAWPVHAWSAPGGITGATALAGTAPAVGIEELAVTIQSRVAGAVAARFSDRGGIQNLTLKLDPGHLGKVEVHLQARGEHLSVRITAASSDAEAALRENLRDLSDAIQDKTGRFQQVEVKVDLRSDQQLNRHAAQNEERQAGNHRQESGRKDRQDNDETGTDQDNDGDPAAGTREG